MTAVIEIPISELAWQAVCRVQDVPPGQGVAVLVSGIQIAIFHSDADKFYALGNRDPYTGANVMSRGILGCRGGTATVISPMLKHTFDLETGRSLTDSDIRLPTYGTRVLGDLIDVGLPPW